MGGAIAPPAPPWLRYWGGRVLPRPPYNLSTAYTGRPMIPWPMVPPYLPRQCYLQVKTRDMFL